ncbi:MAG: glutamate-5-semialdehyde dehydrogenase [Burkholderiaceae bacterium]|nr:glutamate-5-semialdehyde dehydrogenase [Burkholderiaceae bacterium]
MTSSQENFRLIGQQARDASSYMARAETKQKNAVLLNLCQLLKVHREELRQANDIDLANGKKSGLSDAFLDRLRISDTVFDSMIDSLKQIVSLPDPIGEVIGVKSQPTGIMVGQMRVPLGVIGIIYESRPNVTIDAAALCIKSGNATILRGGSDAIESNRFLGSLIQRALDQARIPRTAVQVIQNPDRSIVRAMITSPEYVDVIVPRGGKKLTSLIASEATVPTIKHLDGICHTYVEKSADLALAIKVTDNAKTQRFSPCNATETLLVDQAIAKEFLTQIGTIWSQKDIEMRCDPLSFEILSALSGTKIKEASKEDWSTEYNAPIISIRVVSNIDEAIEHINQHGSHHTDAIITTDVNASNRFLREVDSSSVMLNTSTRFADGFEYGLGAEIGISTDKLHARGPVGLNGLTSLKYVVYGHGELRG